MSELSKSRAGSMWWFFGTTLSFLVYNSVKWRTKSLKTYVVLIKEKYDKKYEGALGTESWFHVVVSLNES